MVWLLWLLVGGAALYGESLSQALFLLNAAVAAVAAALLAALGVAVSLQVAAFVLLSVALIGLLRPRLLRALKLTGSAPARALTNQGRLTDRLGTVVQTVTRDGGTIRLGHGEFWTACVDAPAQQVPVGEHIRVTYLDGLVAHVRPAPDGAD